MAIASYYTQILVQFDKFSLFFLSPHSYAKLSIIILGTNIESKLNHISIQDFYSTFLTQSYNVSRLNYKELGL